MRDLTCAEVEERDLEAGYLAGRLTREESEAYEAHFFGCDRCWAALETALALRAAVRPRRAARIGWRPLAAAAAVVLAVGTGWFTLARRSPEEGEALRGAGDTLPARFRPVAGGLAVDWPRDSAAGSYRVRLFSAEGVLLLERTTADTGLAVVPPAGTAFIEVTAMDSLLDTRATSGLMPLPPSR